MRTTIEPARSKPRVSRLNSDGQREREEEREVDREPARDTRTGSFWLLRRPSGRSTMPKRTAASRTRGVNQSARPAAKTEGERAGANPASSSRAHLNPTSESELRPSVRGMLRSTVPPRWRTRVDLLGPDLIEHRQAGSVHQADLTPEATGRAGARCRRLRARPPKRKTARTVRPSPFVSADGNRLTAGCPAGSGRTAHR